jgi:hypothetical protein
MINANCPTLSYIEWKGLLITYKNQTYQILNSYTNKPYIYWDYNNDPYTLTTSNKSLSEKEGLFYIIYNNKGIYTLVPQDEIDLSFSESGSRDLVSQKVQGLMDKQSQNESRFTTIEVTTDGIKTAVGSIKEDMESAKQTISEIEQENNQISASVSSLEKEYNFDKEMATLKDDTNIALLGLQSVLGLFASDMNTFMEDNVMSEEEQGQIDEYKITLDSKRVLLNTQIDKVIAMLESQGKTVEATKLTSQKTSLNKAVDNLLNNINTVCADGKFTNAEMTTIITYVGNVNSKINETNNMIDEYIFLETGGALVEEISKLNLKQNEIKMSVSKNEQNVNGIDERLQIAEQTLTPNGISNLVKDKYYNKDEVNEIKNEIIAEHNTSLEGITSRISATETNVTTIQNTMRASIKNVETMYYLSTSSTELLGGSWSKDVPTDLGDKYLWSKSVYTYIDNTTSESTPICITTMGSDGADGEKGDNGYTIILTDEVFIVECDLNGNPL